MKKFRLRVYGDVDVLHSLSNASRSAIFYKDMPEDLFYELVHHKLTWYYHIWAISPNLYKEHPKLV
jgi:hypothetical protein